MRVIDGRQEAMRLRRPGEDTLRLLIRPLLEPLSDPNVTEVLVNKPYQFMVERLGEWRSYTAPDLDYGTLESIAILSAAMTGQDVGPDVPICASTLPDGQRVQIVVYPAVAKGTVSLTIRRPPGFRPTLEYLEEYGAFQKYPGLATKLRNVVLDCWNILVVGAVGSGKTTLTRVLIDCIPDHERSVSIEDTPEWLLDRPNHVSLFYSDAGQNVSRIQSEDLFKSALRMRPDRILVQELRDGAVRSYMRALAQHPGGITTIHANSARGAFEALRLLVNDHDEKTEALFHNTIDLIVYCEKDQRRLKPAYQVTGLHEKESAHA